MLSSLAELWHMLRYNHICNYSEGSDAVRAACWCLNKLAWNIKNTCTASGTEIMCLIFRHRNQILCRDIGKTYFTWRGLWWVNWGDLCCTRWAQKRDQKDERVWSQSVRISAPVQPHICYRRGKSNEIYKARACWGWCAQTISRVQRDIL